MDRISNHLAQSQLINRTAVIIDVREPREFLEYHIPGALNIPSSNYQKSFFSSFENQNIYLVCQSGNRATGVGSQLIADGFSNVKILENHMESIQQPVQIKGWSIDRQFRMTLGLLLAIFLILYFFGIHNGLVIPIILCVGLIFTSIIDRCYMRMGIARLPWNRHKSV
jgi:rhodanese-related sulfurtransferase